MRTFLAGYLWIIEMLLEQYSGIIVTETGILFLIGIIFCIIQDIKEIIKK